MGRSPTSATIASSSHLEATPRHRMFRSYYRPTAYDDDWTDIRAQGAWPKWFGGVVIPLALIGYGAYCLANGAAILPGRDVNLELHGRQAAALSTASIGLGVFLHSHYFWGNI